MGSLRRADTGTDLFTGVNRHREVGLMLRAVVPDHQRQTNLSGTLDRDRHADQAAGFGSEEVDDFGGDLLSCNDQVTLIFAILVIHQDDHLTFANVIDDVGDTG